MKNVESQYIETLNKKYKKSLQALNQAAIIKNKLIDNHHPIAIAEHVEGNKYKLPIVVDTRGVNQDKKGEWYWWASGIVVESSPVMRRDKWKKYA